MGKYEPLSRHLREQGTDRWTATFAEIEAVLGVSLPPSAHQYREWWANQRGAGHSQAKGGGDAGWQVWSVNLKRRNVEFRRTEGSPERRTVDPDAALFDRAASYLGVSDRGQVIREALKALCEREAGHRLARLGGTMPDLEAPPRRRFG